MTSQTKTHYTANGVEPICGRYYGVTLTTGYPTCARCRKLMANVLPRSKDRLIVLGNPPTEETDTWFEWSK